MAQPARLDPPATGCGLQAWQGREFQNAGAVSGGKVPCLACAWSASPQARQRIVYPVRQLSLQLHCMCAMTQHWKFELHALHTLQA